MIAATKRGTTRRRITETPITSIAEASSRMVRAAEISGDRRPDGGGH